MRILVAIESCESHHDRVLAQFRTWAKPYTDGHNTLSVLALTGRGLGVSDDYDHLPYKTQAICQVAKENYDFVFKADTDLYVVLDRLLKSGFENYDYTGHLREGYNYAYGGPGYWLSRKAMEILARAECMTGNEDQWVGGVLADAGIPLHHDRRYALYESPLPGNDVITEHLSSRTGFEIEMMYQAHDRFMGVLQE